MKILVTGAAGFIGYHLINRLIEEGEHDVVGIDNINKYYDVNLKYARLEQLGINRDKAEIFEKNCTSEITQNFHFIRTELSDKQQLENVFESAKFEVVINLAAQAGVRYSLENPEVYVDSNIVGFANLLECCRHYSIEHLIYASSSSVYGQNKKIPFSVTDNVDEPVSLYAATKKSNELMAYTYSHLYNFKTTGLRFFTVYGPWGRPDMAMFLFTDAIIKNEPIKVFNKGQLERDFTYISDIIDGVVKVLEGRSTDRDKYELFNIGNSQPVKLMDFIEEIEFQVGKKAEKRMLPMQPGDVNRTWADVSDLKEKYGYKPEISIKQGVKEFIEWYKTYYKIN
jgi:UDP-glucuronate 4-epimerase